MIERFYKYTVLILNQRTSTLYFSQLHAFKKILIDIRFDVKD